MTRIYFRYVTFSLWEQAAPTHFSSIIQSMDTGPHLFFIVIRAAIAAQLKQWGICPKNAFKTLNASTTLDHQRVKNPYAVVGGFIEMSVFYKVRYWCRYIWSLDTSSLLCTETLEINKWTNEYHSRSAVEDDPQCNVWKQNSSLSHHNHHTTQYAHLDTYCHVFCSCIMFVPIIHKVFLLRQLTSMQGGKKDKNVIVWCLVCTVK